MKFTNEELQGVGQALQELGKLRMPMALAVRVFNMQRRIEDHLQDVEKVRLELVGRHSPEGANRVTPEDPGWETFLEEYRELVQTSAEVDGLTPIPLYLRGDEASFTPGFERPIGEIEPNVLRALGELLELREASTP